MNIFKVQKLLKQYHYTGWLFHDFHGHDFITKELCLLHGRTCTRHLFYYVPVEGEPIKILSAIEPLLLDHLPGEKLLYKGKTEMDEVLRGVLHPGDLIACQYSPKGNVPVISSMDAGIVEYIQSIGVEIVSSADLLQYFGAVLTEEQIQSHKEAGKVIHKILDQSFTWIRNQINAKKEVTEWTFLRKMEELIEKEDIVMDGLPFLGVNEHASDPGYEPTKETASPISEGSRLIIDIAGRLPQDNAIYYDVSWCMNVGEKIDPEYQKLFDIVYEVRERAREYIQDHMNRGILVRGCDVDRLTQEIIEQYGLKQYIMHRTGHNIGHECHGIGANLDNYETHDTRTLLPGTMFSIEPGIYTESYGVRLEYDVYITQDMKTQVFGPIQKRILVI